MNNRKAVAHLLHGMVGSGKTTLAHEIVRQHNAIRFSPDEWMIALFGNNPSEAVFREQLDKVLELIWIVALDILNCGQDVVLDFGFWTRASRDEARYRLTEAKVTTKLYALSCAVEVARERVKVRNQTLANNKSLLIDDAAFELFLTQFETLQEDEEHVLVDSG